MISTWPSRAALRLTLGVLTLAAMPAIARADVADATPGRWSGGAGVGFWANTPDGIEFALEGHAEYAWTPALSVGPLAQYAGAGNDHLVGVSLQVKYGWAIPGARRRARVAVQGGVGFVWADIEDADTGATSTDGAFLIPVGISLDYAVTRRVAFTVEILVNLTALGEKVRVGGRAVDLRTNVMPALYLGVRF
jgi:hypothetical protein